MDSQRRFFCARSTQLVVICQRGDRGQRYCSVECSRAAKRDNHRDAPIDATKRLIKVASSTLPARSSTAFAVG